MLIPQLENISVTHSKRRKKYELYKQLISDISPVRIPTGTKQFNVHAHHLFPIVVEDARLRDQLINYLQHNSIPVVVNYRSLTVHNELMKIAACPYNVINSIYLGDRLISLPFYPDISDDDIYIVVDMIKTFFESKS